MNDPESARKITFSSHEQVGLVRKKCRDNGIVNIESIAAHIQKFKDMQVTSGNWCYEIFTEKGSDAEGTVVDHSTGVKSDCIIWSINHYLAFNRHPAVIASAKNALDIYGTGCGTSAMSGGHNQLHKDIEEKMAQVLGKENAILFTSGYSANIGAISALARGSSNLVLIDKDVHASLVDGCKLAGCKYLPFKHNSVSDLEQKLAKYSAKYENIFVVVESVYSMTGNHAPLEAIVELKSKHNFKLFVDEAHAFGIYGKKGGGRCDALGIANDVDFIMTTLSKSTGSIGGIIAASRDLCMLLQIEANAYIFQAALTPPDAAAVIKSLDLMISEQHIVDELWVKTQYFRNALTNLGFDIGEGVSPIIPVYIRDSEKLLLMGKEMLLQGIFTTAITYPAVHHQEVRFRFIVNASHTYAHIDKTVAVLESLAKEYNIIPEKNVEYA